MPIKLLEIFKAESIKEPYTLFKIANILDILGMCYINMNDFEQAEKNLMQAAQQQRELIPHDPSKASVSLAITLYHIAIFKNQRNEDSESILEYISESLKLLHKYSFHSQSEKW